MSVVENHYRETEEKIRREFEEAFVNPFAGAGSVTFRAAWLEMPIGTMLAVGDDDFIYLLSFINTPGVNRKFEFIQQRLGVGLEMGESPAIESIRDEMEKYFTGDLRDFLTPLNLVGTDFQLSVWNELRRVPYGFTTSYIELSKRIGRPSAYRAVAQANSQAPIQIVIPCHRVINSDGRLGGYPGGTELKKWLLDFEQGNLREDA